MKPAVYAKAMFALSSAGKSADDVVKGVVTSLKRRGALELLPKVLSAYTRLVQKEGSKAAILTVARKTDMAQALQESDAQDGITVKVDERLIGGYRLENDGKLVDASFKAKLLQVYRNATAA